MRGDERRENRTGVEDTNADLVRLRRCDLDLFDLQGLTGAPADGSLALDGLSSGVGHLLNSISPERLCMSI